MEKKKISKVKASRNVVDFSTRFMMWQGAALMLIAFVYIFTVTFFKIPTENQKFADIILGFILGSVASTIVQFYYGSSNSSSEKDNVLTKLHEMMHGIGRTFMEQSNGLVEDKVEKTEHTEIEPNSTKEADESVEGEGD